jgi:hypothetical protein
MTPNFPALQLLNDPQTFAEKLYDNLSRYDKRFSLEHKILIMQLLSRVMGAHKLCVLSFYTYIVKYLAYHQLRVPLILVALAQSVHDLTPSDALTPVVQKITAEFVHPGVGSEVIAAGINSIREGTDWMSLERTSTIASGACPSTRIMAHRSTHLTLTCAMSVTYFHFELDIVFCFSDWRETRRFMHRCSIP